MATRCENCRRDLRAWGYLLESLLAWIPCLLTQRWFFRQVGGWREKVALYFVQYYYGAGRRWPSDGERKTCICQRNPHEPQTT